MAEPRPGGEPTEKPTPKRLQDARKKGQVAKSRDLSGALVFWAGFTVILMMAPAASGRLLRLLRLCFGASAHPSNAVAWSHLELALTWSLSLLAPLLGAVVLGAVVAGFVQTRGLFTFEPLKPKLSHLNVLSGLKRLFGKDSLFTLMKTLVFFGVAATVAYFTLRQQLPTLMRTLGAHPRSVAQAIFEVRETLGFRMGPRFVLAGVGDYAFNWHRQRKKLMMTKYEVKKESKESEGDPEHKARRQELHGEILEEAMMANVETADFVVCNPTRLALAVKYRSEAGQAPKVVAKGRNLLANKIKEVARRAGVPVFRDVSLAKALWELELDQEIPEELYEAVAAILRTVYEEHDGSRVEEGQET